MKKRLPILLRAVATLSVWFASGYVLYKFEYLLAFGDIDNIVGMLPVALALTAATGITIIVWMTHTRQPEKQQTKRQTKQQTKQPEKQHLKRQTKQHLKQQLPLSVTLSVLIVLSVALFPTALRGNWWINPNTSGESEAAPDLSLYAPFSVNSKIVKLNEPSTLRLGENLPVLDGATALYPIYAAFAEAAYNEDAFSQGDVLCTNTRGAYEALITGERDIIFVASVSEQQLAAARAAGVELCFTPIGREAFVFLVGKENPINDISYQQLRNIYSGKTAYWSTLGWPEGGRIIAFQRPEGSGSQTGLQMMVMKDLPLQVPQPLPDDSLIGTNSLMKQVSVKWRGVQPALGYSYRFYATTMYANPDVKLLAINGVEPSIANTQNGSYPFVGDFYAVTVGEPQGNAKLLIDWILSPQGQEILEKTGYVPL